MHSVPRGVERSLPPEDRCGNPPRRGPSRRAIAMIDRPAATSPTTPLPALGAFPLVLRTGGRAPRRRRIAVIGCGHWGYNHVRTFGQFADCAVTAVDLNQERLARVAHDFPQIEVESNVERVLREPGIEAVVIATPTITHYELADAALRSGKHVLCEKPLCRTSLEARRLSDLAAKRDRRLMVGHIYLFNPALEMIRRQIEQGALGTLRYLSSSRTNLGPIRGDVNAAYDLAVHDIAIFNSLLGGEPVEVMAAGGKFVQAAVEDVVFITLRYPENRLAHVHASWLNPKKVRQLTLVGSSGMLTWDEMDPRSPLAVYDCGAKVDESPRDCADYGEFQRISMWNNEVRLPKIGGKEPLKEMCRQFLGAIDSGTVARSDGRFSEGVVRVLEAVNQSLALQGTPVALAAAAVRTERVAALATRAA
jgi:predicted dehydrogenase